MMHISLFEFLIAGQLHGVPFAINGHSSSMQQLFFLKCDLVYTFYRICINYIHHNEDKSIGSQEVQKP